jgi:iron complex transport system substrate-binding protein
MPASALLLTASAASLNLCTDEYLLLLARPQEIASVSYLSAEPLESSLWRQASRHHLNRGSIEDVVSLRPKLLLTMGGGGRATALLARRIGIRTLDLAPPATPADVASNLRAVAKALGDPQRAEPLVRRLDALQSSAPPAELDTIWLGGGGQSLTRGSVGTQWLALAGLRQRPLAGGRASLEDLVTRPPEVVVQSNYRSGQLSRSSRWLDHPVVRGLRARRIETDGRPWTCMGPLMIGEIERLRAVAR